MTIVDSRQLVPKHCYSVKRTNVCLTRHDSPVHALFPSGRRFIGFILGRFLSPISLRLHSTRSLLNIILLATDIHVYEDVFLQVTFDNLSPACFITYNFHLAVSISNNSPLPSTATDLTVYFIFQYKRRSICLFSSLKSSDRINSSPQLMPILKDDLSRGIRFILSECWFFSSDVIKMYVGFSLLTLSW